MSVLPSMRFRICMIDDMDDPFQYPGWFVPKSKRGEQIGRPLRLQSSCAGQFQQFYIYFELI